MASLTEKFKSTFNGTTGTTTSSSFLQVMPVENEPNDEFNDRKLASSLDQIEEKTGTFPNLKKVKVVNMVLAFYGFLDEVSDLM